MRTKIKPNNRNGKPDAYWFPKYHCWLFANSSEEAKQQMEAIKKLFREMFDPKKILKAAFEKMEKKTKLSNHGQD